MKDEDEESDDAIKMFLGNWRWKVGSARLLFLPQSDDVATPTVEM
jgi:hypothetical protein